MENPYQWHITEHAKKRWETRIQRPLSELEDLLDRSKPIPKALRKILVQASKSARHQECLAKGGGFGFRIAERIVFVLENLSVVTVYPIPDAYAEVRREANRKAKKNAKVYKAKMVARAALLAEIAKPAQGPAEDKAMSPEMLGRIRSPCGVGSALRQSGQEMLQLG